MPEEDSPRRNMRGNFTITIGEDKHLPEIYQIEKLSFPQPYSLPLLEALTHMNRNILLVATSRDKVLGYIIVSVEGERGHVISIAVSPEYRRTGVGRSLLNEATRILKDRGVKSIHLEARRSNIPTLRFYEKLGFKLTGFIKAYYEDGEDANLFSKQIT